MHKSLTNRITTLMKSPNKSTFSAASRNHLLIRMILLILLIRMKIKKDNQVPPSLGTMSGVHVFMR